jgi:hypothetical protein
MIMRGARSIAESIESLSQIDSFHLGISDRAFWILLFFTTSSTLEPWRYIDIRENIDSARDLAPEVMDSQFLAPVLALTAFLT